MKILYIEACNYIDFPVGGQLSFAKQIIQTYGNEFKLVGISTANMPIGIWTKKEIHNFSFDYFSLYENTVTAKKPLIPRRLSFFFALKKYKKAILSEDVDVVITRAPEAVLAISRWNIPQKIYYFAGTANPLSISRRWYGRVLSIVYDSIFFPTLKRFTKILAAADIENILEVEKRSKGIIKAASIIQFPTRINTEIFKNKNKKSSRKKLDLNLNQTIIVTTGRLHWAKGWQFMIDAFSVFHTKHPDSTFYFIGDGDARGAIELYIKEKQLTNHIFLLGFQSHEVISDYLNAADVYIMGSIKEGWATSLVEARACGVPVCTTLFSSAIDLVEEGVTGYVVPNATPELFAQRMKQAMHLSIDQKRNVSDIKKFSIGELKNDFDHILFE